MSISVIIDVDSASAAEILSRYRVGGMPATVITDSKGDVLQWKQRGMSKAEFLELLEDLNSPAAEDL